MLYPSINDLRDKVDSKYTLVSMASKRARDIIDGLPTFAEAVCDKPVSIATVEIANDMIGYSRQFSTEAEAQELFGHPMFDTSAGFAIDLGDGEGLAASEDEQYDVTDEDAAYAQDDIGYADEPEEEE